jgi:hypothetical protein
MENNGIKTINALRLIKPNAMPFWARRAGLSVLTRDRVRGLVCVSVRVMDSSDSVMNLCMFQIQLMPCGVSLAITTRARKFTIKLATNSTKPIAIRLETNSVVVASPKFEAMMLLMVAAG